jgi:hypothetical protein
MLGAFARTTGLVSLDALRAAVEDSDFRDAGLRQNLEALERGYNETRVHKIALSPSPSPEAGEGGVVAPSARKSDGRVAA